MFQCDGQKWLSGTGRGLEVNTRLIVNSYLDQGELVLFCSSAIFHCRVEWVLT
jgi:hypothetical protein